MKNPFGFLNIDARNVLKALFQLCLMAAALFAFWKGYSLAETKDKAAETGLTYGVGIFCLIFAFLSSFRTFKGLGIEAETWSQTQEEAAHLVANLKSLLQIVSEQTITTASRLGFWDSAYTRGELLEAVEKIDAEMRKNNIPEPEIHKAKTPFYLRVARSLAKPIKEEVRKRLAEIEKQRRETMEAFPQPIRAGEEYHIAVEAWRQVSEEGRRIIEFLPDEHNYPDTPALLRELINNLSNLGSEEKGRIIKQDCRVDFEELDYFCQEYKLRNKERWLAAEPH